MCRSLPGSENTFPSTLVRLALSTEGRGRSRDVWLLTVGEQRPLAPTDQVGQLPHGPAAGSSVSVPRPVLSLGLAAYCCAGSLRRPSCCLRRHEALWMRAPVCAPHQPEPRNGACYAALLREFLGRDSVRERQAEVQRGRARPRGHTERREPGPCRTRPTSPASGRLSRPTDGAPAFQ